VSPQEKLDTLIPESICASHHYIDKVRQLVPMQNNGFFTVWGSHF